MPDIFDASKSKEKPIKKPAGIVMKEAKPKTKPEKAAKLELKEAEVKKKRQSVAEVLKRERTTGLFASVSVRPPKIKFDTQEKDEEVILLLRKHPITNFGWIFLTLVFAGAPLLVFNIFTESFIPQRFMMVSILAWYTVTISFAFEKFLLWFFTVSIVTDERIVDVDYPTLLYRRISDTKLDKIQDKTVAMGGLFQSIFNYGDVIIQTAGEQPEFEFAKISNPERVVKILNMLLLEEEQEVLEGRVR
ncbi:MAG: PH domain-containing protein [Patescibacteria group bacterium]|nr:PH domain-containing protein [Patescibacteria group bacterium]